MTNPLVTYLVSHRKILAVLCAPTDSAVQAFVHITVPLIWPVSAIIPPITESPLRDAASIGAHEEGAVAQASWKRARHWLSLAQRPAISRQSWGMFFELTMDLDRLIPFKKSSLGCSAFCFRHMSPPVSWASGAAGDTDEEIPVASQTAVLPAARHLRFRGSSSEWSGQSA